MSKHTQGPFVVEHELQETPLDSIPIIGGPEGRIVCEVSADRFTVEETQANAILFAAAPLLLAACQFKAHTGMEDDLLYYIAEHLLSESRAIQEGFEKGGGNEDSPRLAAMYRKWSDQLFAKQKLQAAALAAALGPVEEPPTVPHG